MGGCPIPRSLILWGYVFILSYFYVVLSSVLSGNFPVFFCYFPFCFSVFWEERLHLSAKAPPPFRERVDGKLDSRIALCAYSALLAAQHSPMPANNYELCIMNYELFKRRCVRGSYGLSVKGSEPCTYHCHGYKEGRRCHKNFRSVKGAVHARNITYQ